MQLEAVDGDLLPEQLVRPKPDASMPAKRRMAAVLAVALADHQTHAAATDLWGKRRFGAVEAWFMSDDPRWPFSFVAICEAPGLEAVRRTIEERTAR